MPNKVFSIELCGLNGHLVEIEVDTRSAQPAFTIVGLPDTAVQEAKERVLSAVKNSGFPLPRGRIIVNLAPANLKKAGPRYDLAMALGLIAFSGRIPTEEFTKTIFLGELALDGNIRPINGILASAEYAKKIGFTKIYVPKENAHEASIIKDVQIIPVGHLSEAIQFLSHELSALPLHPKMTEVSKPQIVDMASIKGQFQAKRALEIAAAGGHNLLFNGAPGAGKTYMARALCGILPELTDEEMLEITKIYSVAGLLPPSHSLITTRPFRVIHHTASAVSIVGGGNIPGPGEITLAHRGVLFLDEIAEFPSQVLEVLRQPMEDRTITVSRARATITYPAQFTLVASMNPCPCGYRNSDNGRVCECPPWKVERYQRKLSGPLLDRIDLHLAIQPVEYDKLLEHDNSLESSATIKKRVQTASRIQHERYSETGFFKNAEIDNQSVLRYCQLSTDSKKMLEEAVQKFNLSARSYFRILKVARTIADLENCEAITLQHISEALHYRCS